MGRVKDALKQLEEEGYCTIRPHGGSMKGRIESGQVVHLEKVSPNQVVLDDVALVRWKGNYLLHIIKDSKEGEVLIGNNLGKLNGWIPIRDVIAMVVRVED